MLSTRITACSLAAAGMLFIGSQAMAQAPAQIFACVNQQGGIRIVAQNAGCGQNETRLTWNVAGPQGPAGPAGPAGSTGPAGPQGPAGPLAFSEYSCNVRNFDFPVNRPIPFNFTGNTGGGGVGGNLASAENFVLQQGTYQLEFHADLFGPSGHAPTLLLALDWVPVTAPGPLPWEIGIWNAAVGASFENYYQYHITWLVKSGPNQVLSIRSGGYDQPVTIGPQVCNLLLTKLQ